MEQLHKNFSESVYGGVGEMAVWGAAIHQEQLKKKSTARTDTPAETTEEPQTHSHKAGEELKAELDDLLDEIDGVLEENAEEFVRSYVQKGGQ